MIFLFKDGIKSFSFLNYPRDISVIPMLLEKHSVFHRNRAGKMPDQTIISFNRAGSRLGLYQPDSRNNSVVRFLRSPVDSAPRIVRCFQVHLSGEALAYFRDSCEIRAVKLVHRRGSGFLIFHRFDLSMRWKCSFRMRQK